MADSLKFKINQLFSSVIVYGLTSSLQNILGFLLLPVLTIYYTTEEFGVYSIILLASSLAGALFFFGASSALGRFYYDEDSVAFQQAIISAALAVTGVGATVLILISTLWSSTLSMWIFETSLYSLHIQLSLIGTAFGFLLNTMTLILRYEKRSILFMKVTILGVLVNFAITYMLLTVYSFGILAPIWGTLISNFAIFSYLIVSYIPKLTFDIRKGHVTQILHFGLQAAITGVLFYLLDWIDRLIIKDLLPMADVGIYSLGYRIAAIINVLLITPFSLIWAPIRMEHHKSHNNTEFMIRICSYFNLTGVLLILLSVLFGSDLMALIFINKDYASASAVFPIIMLAILFFGFQNILDFGIYISKKVYFYVIICSIGIVINVLLNYVLIPKYGYIAAAYVSLITYFFTSTLIYIISSRYYKLNLEWLRIFVPIAVLVVIYFLSTQTKLYDSNSLLKKIITFILILVGLVKFWANASEKDYLYRLFKRAEKV